MVEIQHHYASHPSTLWVALQNRSKIAKVARTRSAFNHVVNEGRLPLNVNIHKLNSYISMHKLLPISTNPTSATTMKNAHNCKQRRGSTSLAMRGVRSLYIAHVHAASSTRLGIIIISFMHYCIFIQMYHFCQYCAFCVKVESKHNSSKEKLYNVFNLCMILFMSQVWNIDACYI